jgi:hypothetical protein
MIGMAVRALARLWVISLLFVTAAFSGIAIYHLYQTRAELAELRQEPGPDAYAILAYKRELERQIRANAKTWHADVAPTPPPRPRLMEEIDLARRADPAPAPVRRPSANAPISAPD